MYAFGGVSVYLDQSVCFTETPRGSGVWSPLGLEDLLALTGNKPSAAPAAASASSGRGGGASQNNGGGSHGFGGLD